MTIRHHPSDETLLRYSTGRLGAAPALVVAAHLEGCEHCRSRVADFEAVGGALIDEMPPASMAADALDRTLERLETKPAATAPIVSPRQADLGIELPASLRHCEIGPWRWLGPGFRWSKITVPGSPQAKLMFLRGRAGLRLPAHGHTGTEFMQVLYGSLSDGRGRYELGDLDEADADVDHQPVVGMESECICLAALEGDTRLHGLLGRILRPFVGF
ncbi:ChrR family anti-sigma-E factor [Rhizobium sp. BK251]|uniref:ChrR family anti-sigma-E factor n=1 Tax=Rhizobium sp. BK251 TaxID=2512125 RepID=UPI00104D2538|nr:ChrR family anti-sigma-E factor [Rhizobium sp. BK251]TCL68402.1 ChrR-like anti-ECFsigma factor [Rhizobium sp. BK251]